MRISLSLRIIFLSYLCLSFFSLSRFLFSGSLSFLCLFILLSLFPFYCISLSTYHISFFSLTLSLSISHSLPLSLYQSLFLDNFPLLLRIYERIRPCYSLERTLSTISFLLYTLIPLVSGVTRIFFHYGQKY